MSDDIAARLRILWTSCTDRINDERTEAADEIERLREQLRLANLDNFNITAEIEWMREAIAHWSQADQEWLNIDVPTAAAMEKLRVAERKLRDAAGIRLPIQGDPQFDGVTE